MKKDKELEKGISDIVGALTDPIIVFPGGWGDTLPDWLKESITLERMVENLKALKGEKHTGTDSEACAYLMTVSLTQPIDYDWVQIYLYVATRSIEKWRTKDTGAAVPKDIRVESLNSDQMRDLDRLKEWLFDRRTKAREEEARGERRQQRQEMEKEEAARKSLQPALFDL